MWNAIFIGAVFQTQTEDLLGNTIRSLAPCLDTLKWGVTLLRKLKGRSSSLRDNNNKARTELKDYVLRFKHQIERYPTCVQKKIGSGFDEELMDTKLQLENAALNFGRFFSKISRCDQHRHSLPTKKWSNEYWNHVQEVAVKLEDSLQI